MRNKCILNVSGSWYPRRLISLDRKSVITSGPGIPSLEIILSTMGKGFKSSPKSRLKAEGSSMAILSILSLTKREIKSKEATKFHWIETIYQRSFNTLKKRPRNSNLSMSRNSRRTASALLRFKKSKWWTFSTSYPRTSQSGNSSTLSHHRTWNVKQSWRTWATFQTSRNPSTSKTNFSWNWTKTNSSMSSTSSSSWQVKYMAQITTISCHLVTPPTRPSRRF